MRRAGPLVWIGFDGLHPPDNVLELAREGEIGGATLFARNTRDARQTADLVRALHAAGPLPLAIDQEGGHVVRIGFGTVFPSAMAFGATRDAALAERAAGVVARELRALGIGLLLAPVCDVNVEPGNPVIGTRAFSDDPALCAALAAAWIRGAQAEGVACTAKHFPGHGPTSKDTHLELVDVDADRGTLERRELVPFRAAIDARVAAVMTAHVRYPALDDAPATYSGAILTGLLRGRLGFDGLVMTDALEMAGAQGHRPGEAIRAGVDVALLSRMDRYADTIDDIEGCCTSEVVPGERIADALRRTRAFGARYAFMPTEEFPATDHALAREVAIRALTHVGPPLPDLRASRIVCAAFAPRSRTEVEDLADPLGVLERELRRYFGERLTFLRDPERVIFDRDATLVIVTTSACFDDAQAARARRLAAHRPALLCAIRSPYDARLFGDLPALLTYSDVPASCLALAACLGGEVAPRGTLPIRLA